MLWRKFVHKALAVGAFGVLLVLSACTFTIQPEADMGEVTPAPQAEGGDSAMVVATEFVLPSGTSCLYAATGETAVFDEKRVTYYCTPIEVAKNATQTLALLDVPVIAGPTEYLVDRATIAETEGGVELHSSRAITFTAWEVVLADGRVCLHAGFGATMGFEGKRLNYTCDKGDSSADEVGLMGELVHRGEGVWYAQIDEIGRDANGFVQLSSNQVPVAKVSGVEVMRNGDTEGTPEASEGSSEALVGTTWQWEQSLYEGDMVVLVDDPSRYTITFNADDLLGVQLDCNSGGGTYVLDGSSLTFSPIRSTRMACGADSQDTLFAQDLAEVVSYAFADGNLHLTLSNDGVMEFSPVE